MADEEMLMLSTIIVAICAYNVDRDKYKGRRKMWVKPWILCRKVKGAYHTMTWSRTKLVYNFQPLGWFSL